MLLRTPRLVLREFTVEDAPSVLRYQRDSRYLRFYPAPDDEEGQAMDLVGRFVAWQGEVPRRRYQLAIALESSGEVIGNVGLRMERPDSRVAETGFELSPEHWGQGYATEAAASLIDHGFTSIGLRRVHAHCVAENTASERVLQRLGMVREGRLRRHEYFRHRWWDVLVYGVLASEWRIPVVRAGPETDDPFHDH